MIFETISSLLSLLRTKEREAYRQFFLDTMVAIEGTTCKLIAFSVLLFVKGADNYLTRKSTDVLYVASIHANKLSAAHAGSIKVKCLSGTFALIANSPMIFSELPASCRPRSGPGVLVDLTGDARWRPFAASLIKFISKCLTEGTLYVEGLLDISFVTAACSLLCYDDTDLHMVSWWVAYMCESVYLKNF